MAPGSHSLLVAAFWFRFPLLPVKGALVLRGVGVSRSGCEQNDAQSLNDGAPVRAGVWRERPQSPLVEPRASWHSQSSLDRVGERGSAPKGGRHSTIFVNPQGKLWLSSAHLCNGSLIVCQSIPTSGS